MAQTLVSPAEPCGSSAPPVTLAQDSYLDNNQASGKPMVAGSEKSTNLWNIEGTIQRAIACAMPCGGQALSRPRRAIVRVQDGRSVSLLLKVLPDATTRQAIGDPSPCRFNSYTAAKPTIHIQD